MIQWHPLFAKLLRPVLESHYEVQTDVPVGDLPRQADILLLKRTSASPPPFQQLWKHLTTWNVLEYKGRTVSPRANHLDLLVEVGLGIHRRLNEQRRKDKLPALARGEISFWYLANHLGVRFLRQARKILGPLDDCGAGVWRCRLLERMVFLVGSIDLPIDAETLPLHVVGQEPPATALAVGRFVVERPALWERYRNYLAAFQRPTWTEVIAMARASRRGWGYYLDPLFEELGPDMVIQQLAQFLAKEEGSMSEADLRPLLKRIGAKRIVKSLTEEERRELERELRREANG